MENTLKWLVRGSAALVCVLLLVFFLVVIQNTSTIKGEVEYVKDGPYPVSVAAGHIETSLVRLETVIGHMTASQLGAGSEFETAYEDSFDSIESDLQHEIDVINGSTDSSETAAFFQKEYDLLMSRLGVFASMCWHTDEGQSSYEDIVAYEQEYLSPVIQHLLEYNNNLLDRTTSEVDAMYERVNGAIASMLTFSLALLVAVVVMICIYMVTLRMKTSFESQLRDSLNDALVAAESASEAKSAFLANMSHDIRTPMNAIVGLTAIANENIDDKLRVKQCLTRITTSSQHLLSLINDVLDMNKIESGKVALSQEEFSILELADEIEAIFQSQPASKKRNSEVVVENVRHEMLVGDMMRLRQILLNLTSNALKYTNEGDLTRLVIRENDSPREGHASITFVMEDTGIGMEREFVKRIFEPFERERNDFTIFTEGTGLGMAITKNLVDLMGGTITVDSELGIGTTVTFTVEFELASEAGVRRREVFHAGNAPTKAKGRRVRGRVLIVEDNEINMEIAKQLIGSRGAEVDEAFDGLEAVTKVSDAPDGAYDLIFMDWQMPYMNGIEATQAIRKFCDGHGRRQIPIVAMTANAFDSDRQTALEAGMDDFMAKPINIKELEEVLGRFLKPDEEAAE